MSLKNIQPELVAYEQTLVAQLQEVSKLLAKGTKASARRVRKNSLELDKQGKALRKSSVEHIG